MIRPFRSSGVIGATLPVLVGVAVGTLHREAGANPWADDRALSNDPAWFQLAAPLWHSVTAGSHSLANVVVQTIDPWTRASTAGDARAVAAAVTGLAALALMLVLDRLGVHRIAAAILTMGLAGAVLPVSTATVVAQSLLVLLGALMLLVWISRPAAVGGDRGFRLRLAGLGALTTAGALVHPAFMGFAAGVWVVEVVCSPPASRRSVAVAGGTALAVSLAGAAWMLAAEAARTGLTDGVPSMGLVAQALVTGRFPQDLQPAATGMAGEMLTASTSAPAVVLVALVSVACLRADTRWQVAGALLASIGALLFSMSTWVVDALVAVAPIRAASLVVMGLGVSWLWVDGPRGSRALAVATCLMAGVSPYLVPDPTLASDAARVEAFVTAAHVHIGGSSWSADRLALVRALLLGADASAATRTDIAAAIRNAIPDDRRYVLVGGEDADVDAAVGQWRATEALSYPSASSFIASHDSRYWLAVALRGPALGGFCADLLRVLGVAAPGDARDLAVLARLGADPAAHAAAGALDVRYGASVGDDSVPARFDIRTNPDARIRVNAHSSPASNSGLVMTLFDTWRLATQSSVVGDCRAPRVPPIVDRRLHAAYILPLHGASRLPAIPVVSARPVRVPLGETGNAWFAQGWHQPDTPGDDAMRWTAARAADVHVLVSHAQELRVTIDGALAQSDVGANALQLSWNGVPLRAERVGPDGLGDWVAPQAVVRKGLNRLTVHVRHLVVPSENGASDDSRTLGVAVRQLVLAPLTAS